MLFQVLTARSLRTTAALAAGLLAGSVAAQTVDFPNSTLASPPEIGFPFYTPAGGATFATVRTQWLCPDSFLAAQNLQPGLVTKIGLPLAGAARYDTFELRVGATTVPTLGADWTVNLPDQRVQRDLSGQVVHGGGTQALPVNQWIEFDLDFPFHWTPGQGIVVDLTTRISVPGSYLGTTLGTGTVARAYNFAYSPGQPATSFSGWGNAFRMVLETPGLITYGAGCAGTAGSAPSLSSVGTAGIGDTLVIIAGSADASTVGGFLFGSSRSTFTGGSLPLPLGGGCELLVAPDIFMATAIQPSGGGLGNAIVGLTVPLDPQLVGTVLYTQFTQFDAGTAATVPLTFSDAGIVVVF